MTVENKEIEIFREYLQIPSVHPDVDYEPCLKFILKQGKSLNLPVTIFYPAHPKKPVIIITWLGTQPKLPSILLNSHMDVVPVYEEYWTHPPFAAEIDDDGRIFARGTQDMKSVGMQYLAAIRQLKNESVRFKRTIHVAYFPDEEMGSADGMKAFVETEEFRALNVGFALDEGSTAQSDIFNVFYAERSVWRVHFECYGTSGHGSLLHKDTAAEKVRYLIDHLLDYRQSQVEILENNPELTVGDVTSVNMTRINGGVQTNVVPPIMTIVFDMRLAVNVNHEEFEKMLLRWCDEAGGNIKMIFESKGNKVEPTAIDDTNPFWIAFRRAMVDEMNLKIKPQVMGGRTDAWYIRQEKIPALGFSPINLTPYLAHGHDEFIRVDTYLKGIEIYRQILLSVANV